MSPETALLLPLWYSMFLLSVTCHEAAHAWVAYRGGDPTAYVGGQVSLNPLPHVQREPFGTVLVPLLSFLYAGWMMGWASAPYDPHWEQRYPRRAAWMAAAGPLANLVLFALGFALLRFGLAQGWWIVPEAGVFRLDQLVVSATEGSGGLDGLARLGSILLSLNLVLFLFNLLPLPPMDGSAVLAGLFEPARRLRDQMRATPMAGLVGLMIAWYGFGYVFRPVYGLVLSLLYG